MPDEDSNGSERTYVVSAVIHVRPLEVDDVPVVAAIAGALSERLEVDELMRRLDIIWSSSASQPAEVLVGEDTSTGEVVGWVHVCMPMFLTGTPAVSVWGLAVDEAHRGRGVGRVLMAAAERWAVERGATCMRLTSASHRTGTHAFYDRLGYQQEKTQVVLTKDIGS